MECGMNINYNSSCRTTRIIFSFIWDHAWSKKPHPETNLEIYSIAGGHYITMLVNQLAGSMVM